MWHLDEGGHMTPNHAEITGRIAGFDLSDKRVILWLFWRFFWIRQVIQTMLTPFMEASDNSVITWLLLLKNWKLFAVNALMTCFPKGYTWWSTFLSLVCAYLLKGGPMERPRATQIILKYLTKHKWIHQEQMVVHWPTEGTSGTKHQLTMLGSKILSKKMGRCDWLHMK